MSRTLASSRTAFSLIELIVAMAVLAAMILMMAAVVDQTSSLWRRTATKAQSYQAARAGLETLSLSLSQAVLNPSIEYFDTNGNRPAASNTNFTPDQYGRYSDLQFICTTNSSALTNTARTHAIVFQAPQAFATNTSTSILPRLLNSVGFFVAFASDQSSLPAIPALQSQAKSRYRLMQYLQPAEGLQIYSQTNQTALDLAGASLAGNTRILADNIIALILQPKSSAGGVSIGTNYSYDSRQGALTNVTRHQLPPVVSVTMVAMDEDSAARLDRQNILQSTIDTALAGKFTNAALYATNLSDLKTALDSKKIGYRVFTTDVGIRAAKWSDQ
jgi:uncharacterized protein (TIGR02599 family)